MSSIQMIGGLIVLSGAMLVVTTKELKPKKNRSPSVRDGGRFFKMAGILPIVI